ncbi:MAG: phage major capsid protein [Peptococcaceae bacterium]|nr:phage major capsid protein [Peptococcaceae bacterium]
MNKEQYLAKRNELIALAQTLIEEEKIEDAEAKMKEVEVLDAQFEQACKAQANMNALKERAVVSNIAAKSVNIDGFVVDKLESAPMVDEKKAYLNAFSKYLLGRQLEESEKAVFDKVNKEFKNTVQTASTHTVLIPETVRDGIWQEAGEMYPLLKDVSMTFVPGDLTIMKETDSGDDATWYDEESQVQDGDFGLGELNLTGCELAKAIPISWKLKKMSVETFLPYITSKIAEKMGSALAKAIVAGVGKPGIGDEFKPQPKGIVTAIEVEVNTPQVVEYAAVNGITYDDLADAMGKIKSAYKSGSSIYAKSTTIWGQLAKIKDGEEKPLFIPDVTKGGVGLMFGLPVKEDDSVGENEVLIGNIAKGYVINVNENMTIYTQDHVKARYTDYMGYALIDGDVMSTKAFALIKQEAEV